MVLKIFLGLMDASYILQKFDINSMYRINVSCGISCSAHPSNGFLNPNHIISFPFKFMAEQKS